MTRHDDILQLPPNLPRPADDGAGRHLVGLRVPDVALLATSGASVTLARLRGRTVVYCYPRTGRPDEAPPDGWDAIPGARGCTPESCSFRDHHQELTALGARVFGVSTQDTDYQRETASRLHLPFALLSDADLTLATALSLPTFQAAGLTLLKRLTLIIQSGVVEHVFYPVFPPDRHAEEVVAWLRSASGRNSSEQKSR